MPATTPPDATSAPPDSPQQIGHYQVLAKIGEGGMGEVYRARDTRLNREVAIKVLPRAFAEDPTRMARFEREAQLLASLNHPKIAAIYGLEESGATRALVMELVEGPTLAERIGRAAASVRATARPGAGSATPAQAPSGAGSGGKTGERSGSKSGSGAGGARRAAIPLDEALPIAQQIAEALEYAHEHGVVHRDLKPANIKITPDGDVKVLDFGLAKAMGLADASGDMSNSPTLSLAMTEAGLIIGTAAYMAPEQAKGKPVDRRADIWAFGCVLYEMLTGQKAFEGETVSDILAAVIRAEPNWDLLPPDVPPAIRKLMRRCLVKDPKQRLRDMGDARFAVEETVSGADAGAIGGLPLPSAAVRRSALRRALPWFGATLTLIAALAAGWWARSQWGPSARNWSGQRLGGPSVAMGGRISPDGHTLAFQAVVDGLTQVAVMDTDSGDWTVLTKDRTHGYVTELNWSPDGSEIYFDREFSVPRGIYRVSRFGGDERLILKQAMGPEVLPDGSLLAVRVNNDRNFQLFHFWPDSGRLEPLDALFEGADLCPPVRVFRDGKEAVFFGETLEQGPKEPSPHLYILDLTSGKTRRLAPQIDLHAISTALFPLAVSSDDRSVLVDHAAGDLQSIISIPRRGKGPIRTVLSLTRPPWFMDVDKSGNLYLDQVGRPLEVLHFSVDGGTPEILAASRGASEFANEYYTFQLPDGRVLIGSIVAGRSQLQFTSSGGQATPFVQTKEETSFPFCPVGKDEFAFLLGARSHAAVAIASITDGRIVRRLDGIPGSQIRDLAASPEGKTIYYVASRTVWAIPAVGGQPRRIGPGDGVAADPNGRDLIVQLNGNEGVQLAKVSVSGGPMRPIAVQGPLLLADIQINPNAVGKDGRVLVSYAAPNAWFYGAGILDPRSGKIAGIPVKFSGDLLSPAWQAGGGVLSTGWPLTVTLWRFRPVAGGSQ